MDMREDIAYHIRRVLEKETQFSRRNPPCTDMPDSMYALILAGGSGERFWPLSRRARPKQLLSLVSKKTLLEETLARLDGLIPPERTLILTNTEQESAVRKLLGNFPKENILAEPAKRDTAAAIALGTGWVALRDHAATMVVLPADHVITNRAAFQETLSLAADAADETSELVTIGIKPTWACPGFGYIEHGKPVRLRKRPDNEAIHRVVRFREKPNSDLAESLYAGETSGGTPECSYGLCPRCFANLTVTRRSWLIFFHSCARQGISRQLSGNVSSNYHASRSITRSWRKLTAFSS